MKKLLLILTFLFTIFSVNATNYYISTTGSDGSTGLIGFPKLTLGNIFSTKNLNTGDTVFVTAGTYSETGITVGTDDDNFVIQGASLDVSGNPTSIFDAGSTARWLKLGDAFNDNIVINRLTIKDHKSVDSGDPQGGGGIKVIAGCVGLQVNNCIFDNCDALLSGNRGGAIYSVEGITITYCIFRNCDVHKYGGSISIELSPSNKTIINHCKFYSNISGDYGGAIFFGPGIAVPSSIDIENCLFYKNNTTSNSSSVATIVVMNSNSTMNITNCTIVDNGNASAGTGGVLTVATSKMNIINSIIYNNLGSTYKDVYKNTGTVTMKNSFYKSQNGVTLTAPNSINTDPKFTNSASNDYT